MYPSSGGKFLASEGQEPRNGTTPVETSKRVAPAASVSSDEWLDVWRAGPVPQTRHWEVTVLITSVTCDITLQLVSIRDCALLSGGQVSPALQSIPIDHATATLLCLSNRSGDVSACCAAIHDAALASVVLVDAPHVLRIQELRHILGTRGPAPCIRAGRDCEIRTRACISDFRRHDEVQPEGDHLNMCASAAFDNLSLFIFYSQRTPASLNIIRDISRVRSNSASVKLLQCQRCSTD